VYIPPSQHYAINSEGVKFIYSTIEKKQSGKKKQNQYKIENQLPFFVLKKKRQNG
jgi:hypothetical protein